MRALVLVPVLKQAKSQGLPEGAPPAPSRSNEARLEEAIGLARAIDLTIVQGLIVQVNQPRPATLLGTGKIAEIKALLDEHDAGQFAAGDVDLMILKRSYLKTTNLAKAFEISTKVNGGRPYAVFHYCPCRFVEARYMDAPTGDGDDDDAGE